MKAKKLALSPLPFPRGEGMQGWGFTPEINSDLPCLVYIEDEIILHNLFRPPPVLDEARDGRGISKRQQQHNVINEYENKFPDSTFIISMLIDHVVQLFTPPLAGGVRNTHNDALQFSG